MDWLPLIGYLGIGALLKGIFDHFLASRTKTSDRIYAEKREAYIGLLQALREAATKPSDDASKNYALWQARCTLFGSNKVVIASQKLIDTNDDRNAKEGSRASAYQELIQTMREDLSR